MLVCVVVLFICPAAAEIQYGQEAWVTVFDAAGEPNASPLYGAEGKAIAMDSSENVYVLGETGIQNHKTDAIIYKHNRIDGTVAWRDIYNHAGSTFDDASYDLTGDIACDKTGNTYVAINSGRDGNPQKNYRVVIRRYGTDYATGEAPDWTYVYGSGADQGDKEAHALAIDTSGNCYVAGQDHGRGMLFKVNNDGSLGEVAVRQEGESSSSFLYFQDVAVDAVGNIYVCGQGQRAADARYDILVAKYNATGVLQWLTYLDATCQQHIGGNALALSSDASAVYVCGLHTNASDEEFWAVARFRTDDGVNDWYDYYRGSDVSGSQYAKSIALDAAGDVLVAGVVTNTDTGSDMGVVKYQGALSKNRLWEAHYSGGEIGEWEFAADIGADAANNVYVTGPIYNYYPIETMPAGDYATVKYPPGGGTPTWVYHYDYPAYPGQGETPAAMAVAPSGTVAVTGIAELHGESLFDMLTVLYPGSEEGGETPTQPVFIPVLHIQASVPSTAGGAPVTYTYEWTSSNGESLIVADQTGIECMLYQGENGITFNAGEIWTVRITPKSNGITGPTFTNTFTFGDSASELWSNTGKLGLENAVHILQVLSGVR